jgi:hypothetical protein
MSVERRETPDEVAHKRARRHLINACAVELGVSTAEAEAIVDAKRATIAQDENALRTIDLCALLDLELPAPEFVVAHLFPRQSLVLLGGDSGSGKSAFATHACLALGLGRNIGDYFAAEPGAKALYLNAELAPTLMRQCVLQSLAGLGASRSDFPSERVKFVGEFGFADVCFDPGDKGTDDRRRLQDLLETFKPDLVIFDTHRALFAVDDRDNYAVAQCLNWLKRLAIKFNCCIVVVHHMRKLGGGNNSSRERITGARAFIEIPGIVLSAQSEDGRPMTALKVDKTRFPVDDVQQGKQFPVEAIFDPPRSSDGTLGRSGFVLTGPVWAPEQSPAEIKSDEAAADDPKSAKMIAAKAQGILWAEKAVNPFTASELGAAIGEAVRAGNGKLSNKLARAAAASLIDDKAMIRDKSPGVARYWLAPNASP